MVNLLCFFLTQNAPFFSVKKVLLIKDCTTKYISFIYIYTIDQLMIYCYEVTDCNLKAEVFPFSLLTAFLGSKMKEVESSRWHLLTEQEAMGTQ